MTKTTQNIDLESLSIVDCLLDACEFFRQNISACIMQCFPIAIFTIFIETFLPDLRGSIIESDDFSSLNSLQIGSTIPIFIGLVEIFLYSAFAVSWHRYTIFSGKEKYSFPYQFKARELKFMLLATVNAAISGVLALLLLFIADGLLLIALLCLILTPVSLTFFLIFPAIALDQKINLSRIFIVLKTKMGSYFLTMLIFSAGVILVCGGLFLLVWITEEYLHSNVTSILLLLFFSLLLPPFLITILTSTASYLYVRAIGLEEESLIYADQTSQN